jgi:hypothetical protein
MTTLQDWKSNEVAIVNGIRHHRSNRSGVRYCKWPEMEEGVYQLFRARRDARKVVRRGWLRTQAKRIFATCYGNSGMLRNSLLEID